MIERPDWIQTEEDEANWARITAEQERRRSRDFDDVYREEGAETVRKALNARQWGNVEPFIHPDANLSEKGLAVFWANMHQGNWRYDHRVGAWYEFVGSHWQRDKVKRAFHLIGEVANRLGKGQGAAAKSSFVRGAEAFAQADPRIGAHGIWDRDDFLLGTPGKTIELRTGSRIQPDAQHFITRRTSIEPADGEPTLWLRFLGQATGGDAGLIRFLQQVLGYCLTGSTREHALFFIFGPGKNGKSVFLNTASRILGDYATIAGMDTFAASRGDRHPTEVARLDGARLVAASETEEGRAWAEAKIKQLTGGDPIAARFMKQDFFEFLPRFKLVIVGNHQPSLHNVDPATRRRFNIIPFAHTPANPDPDLEEKLRVEHGRILSWMIEGCLDWQRNGLVRPDIVVAATEDYFDAQDMLGQWIAERCETSPNRFEMPTPLFRDWSEFARLNGEEPGTSKAFASALEKRGFQRRKSNGMRAYRGIALQGAGRSGRPMHGLD